MKQIQGQISLDEVFKQEEQFSFLRSCGQCICNSCLYWWSKRCPHGECYDDYRAKEKPYDKAHPDEPPRTSWSNWNKPGEQAHWCRGGTLYPVHYCEFFVKYKGSQVEDCVDAPIQIFQDGYATCSLKEMIGCEVCIEAAEGKKSRNQFKCPYMTDSGCERMITAKNLILDSIAKGENIEMCKEQCCIGCSKRCGYRCGQDVR